MSGDVRDLRLRRATPADDDAIRALLAASYPDNPKTRAEFTAWQYWHNPFGPPRGWVWADDAGRVASHWSAVAVPLRLDGRRTVGAKGVDIATDPAWRGHGLFAGLARRMIDDCREAGVPALLSHPNPASVAAVRRAGAELVARVPAFVRPGDPAWLAARLRLPERVARRLVRVGFGPSRRAGAARLPEVSEVAAPPVDLDALWRAAAPADGFGVVRDHAWWRWRYADRPPVDGASPYRLFEVRTGGRLRGAAVTTVRDAVGGRFAHVLEWLAADDDAARALGAAMTEPGAGADVDGAVVAALPRTALARHARRAGFRRLPRPLEPRPLRFVVAGGTPDDPDAAARLAAAPWSFAWGDLDHL